MDKKTADIFGWLKWFVIGVTTTLVLSLVGTGVGAGMTGLFTKFITITTFCVMLPASILTQFGVGTAVKKQLGFDGRTSLVRVRYLRSGGFSTGYSATCIIWFIVVYFSL